MQSPAQYAVQRRYQRYVFSESLDMIRWLAPNASRKCPGICAESRHGFEFVGVNDDTREQIRTLCASLRPYEGGWY